MSTQESKPINYKFLAIILLPIVALFLGYFIFFRQASKDQIDTGNSNSKNDALLIPDVNDSSKLSSKVSVYEDEKRKMEEKAIENQRSKVSEDDFFNVEDNSSNTEELLEEEKKKEVMAEIKEEPKVKQVYVSQKPKIKKTEPAPEKTIQKEQADLQPEKEEKTYSGFGVYQNKSNTNITTSSPGKQSAGFINAYIDEQTKIVDNASIIFRFSQDVTLNGILFKRNSVAYGKASDNGRGFDINIHNIKNTDGNTYSFDNLYVYNENYSRGIVYDNKVTEAVKEGTNQTAYNSTSDVITSDPTAGTGTKLVTRTLDNTIKAMSREKKNSTTLRQGYKVFIKEVLQ